jgi:RNA recognition motif-containing protein
VPIRHARGLAISEVQPIRPAPCAAGPSFILVSKLILTKLYVGNLPFSATEESVRALFAPHGSVESLSLVSDRDTGRPRGFGFVEMSSSDASRAAEALNGKDFGGRELKVNEARARERDTGLVSNRRY